MNILKSYHLINIELRMISLFNAVVISILIINNIIQNFIIYFENDPEHWRSSHFDLIPLGNSFLFLILIFFVLRCAFIGSEKVSKFLFSQFLWLGGLFAIYFYRFFTKTYYNNLFLEVSVIADNLLWVSTILALYLPAYLFFSLILKCIVISVALCGTTFKEIWDRL